MSTEGPSPPGKGGNRRKTLTKRERQISRLVCIGLSNKEIGRELNLSVGTVKVHLHNIYQKLAIRNRTALAAISWGASPPAGLHDPAPPAPPGIAPADGPG